MVLAPKEFVDLHINANPVVVFSKKVCPYCKDVKEILTDSGIEFVEVLLDDLQNMSAVQDYMKETTGARSVPRVFIGGICIGGCDSTLELFDQGCLIPMVKSAGGVCKN